MAQPDYAKAQSLAESIISDYQITDPVVPVHDIAATKGLSIKVIPMPEKLKGVSGFFDPKEKTIYVNGDDVPRRQMFTVAHELGHFLLEHDPKEYGVLLRFPEVNGKDASEQEANCFAANLLVPELMLRDVMKKYSLTKEHLSTLAKLFGVSKAVMRYRLERME